VDDLVIEDRPLVVVLVAVDGQVARQGAREDVAVGRQRSAIVGLLVGPEREGVLEDVDIVGTGELGARAGEIWARAARSRSRSSPRARLLASPASLKIVKPAV
jgi:hypothetical protein